MSTGLYPCAAFGRWCFWHGWGCSFARCERRWDVAMKSFFSLTVLWLLGPSLTYFDTLWLSLKTWENNRTSGGKGVPAQASTATKGMAHFVTSNSCSFFVFFFGVPVWSCLVSWSLVMFLLFSILVHFVFKDLFWSFHHYSSKALWNGIPGSFAETGLHVWELW